MIVEGEGATKPYPEIETVTMFLLHKTFYLPFLNRPLHEY